MSSFQIKPGSALDRKTKEIHRLYGEICTAARMSLDNAIKMGGILLDVHESPAFKGKWLRWLAECMPFSQPTAWRYMQYYKRREELFKLNNLSEANGLILALPEPPKKKRRRNKVIEALEAKGIPESTVRKWVEESKQADERPGAIAPEPGAEPTPAPEPRTDDVQKGCQPGLLTEDRLTPEELEIVAKIKAYADGRSEGRRKAFKRFICEGGIL
jgi:hypothetical protein